MNTLIKIEDAKLFDGSSLKDKIDKHQEWLKLPADLKDSIENVNKRLYLTKENLRYIDFSGLNLQFAVMIDCDFRGSSFICTNLSGASLDDCDFGDAYLENSIFYNSSLMYSHFEGAESFKDSTVFSNSFMKGATGIRYLLKNSSIRMSCPTEGSFIGWKKVINWDDELAYLIKLQIPARAKRSSATGTKCRCSKAKVLGIYTLNGRKANLKTVTNVFMPGISIKTVEYTVGEYVYPDGFDENRWNECSNGIHFFVDKQAAIDYML